MLVALDHSNRNHLVHQALVKVFYQLTNPFCIKLSRLRIQATCSLNSWTWTSDSLIFRWNLVQKSPRNVWKLLWKFRDCESSSLTNFVVNLFDEIITHYGRHPTPWFIMNVCSSFFEKSDPTDALHLHSYCLGSIRNTIYDDCLPLTFFLSLEILSLFLPRIWRDFNGSAHFVTL